MSRFRAGFWGPRPRWALIPVAAIGAVVAAVILRDPGPDGMLDGPVMVTALPSRALLIFAWSVAPFATVMPEVPATAVEALSVSWPALTVVAPV